MKMIFLSFFISIISMLLIDALWLGIMVKRFYAPNIGHLMSNTMSVLPAIIFYILYAIGLNIFVILPALKSNTGYQDVLLLGLLFGIVTYGTYDLTNQVTLKNWPWIITVVDIAWGGCLAGSVSLISTFITRHFL